MTLLPLRNVRLKAIDKLPSLEASWRVRESGRSENAGRVSGHSDLNRLAEQGGASTAVKVRTMKPPKILADADYD